MLYEGQEVYGVIYHLISPSGKSYVGQTVDWVDRKSHYKTLAIKDQHKIYNAIKKYGWLNMRTRILCTCSSKEELNECETYFMSVYKCISEGYNCKEAGLHGKISEETRARMSAAQKGRKHSEGTKRKISEAKTGKKYSETALTSFREFKKNQVISKETREKMREAHSGSKSHWADKTEYIFYNEEIKEKFEGIRTEFCKNLIF